MYIDNMLKIFLKMEGFKVLSTAFSSVFENPRHEILPSSTTTKSALISFFPSLSQSPIQATAKSSNVGKTLEILQ